LSIVESFRKKNADMKRDRNALSSAVSCWETLLGEYEKQAQVSKLGVINNGKQHSCGKEERFILSVQQCVGALTIC